jgi:hypothetical protein
MRRVVGRPTRRRASEERIEDMVLAPHTLEVRLERDEFQRASAWLVP